MSALQLGEYIKKYRTSRGLTRKQLASELGISPGHLNNLERGEKLPSLKLLGTLAQEMNLSIDFLNQLLKSQGSALPPFPISNPEKTIAESEEELIFSIKKNQHLPPDLSNELAAIVSRYFENIKLKRG